MRLKTLLPHLLAFLAVAIAICGDTWDTAEGLKVYERPTPTGWSLFAIALIVLVYSVWRDQRQESKTESIDEQAIGEVLFECQKVRGRAYSLVKQAVENPLDDQIRGFEIFLDEIQLLANEIDQKYAHLPLDIRRIWSRSKQFVNWPKEVACSPGLYGDGMNHAAASRIDTYASIYFQLIQLQGSLGSLAGKQTSYLHDETTMNKQIEEVTGWCENHGIRSKLASMQTNA